MPLEDDLYKALLDESKSHRERVSTVWLQKFTMLGAIIVFAAVRSESAPATRNPELIIAALLCLPVIAILLDIKLGEFGIHANVIDHFVSTHYTEPKLLGEWERTKWGVSSNSRDRRLIRWRTGATLVVTMAPTCAIAVLSALAAKPFLCGRGEGWLWLAVTVLCLGYVAAGLAWSQILRFPEAKAADQATPR